MGIDYGLGLSNVDPRTGIRYGVISHHEVLQAWCDSTEFDYGQPDEAKCPVCGNRSHPPQEWGDVVTCDDCGEEFEVELSDFAEPLGFSLDDAEYTAYQSGDDCDIFITRSPFYTLCQFCSPCAPGAGYLMSRGDDCRAYCFGHDWFENGKAPYPVYRVSDDSIVGE
jgi:hypothetical protein